MKLQTSFMLKMHKHIKNMFEFYISIKKYTIANTCENQ
jgi:hypothetical protein